MWARSRAKIRFVLVVFLLLGLIIQTAYASISDVDSDGDFDRAGPDLIHSLGKARTGGRSSPEDAEDGKDMPTLDPLGCTSGWIQDLSRITSDLAENAHPHQALPTRDTLTRNGSTFDKPDGTLLSSLRSFIPLPTPSTKILFQQNPIPSESHQGGTFGTSPAVYLRVDPRIGAGTLLEDFSDTMQDPAGAVPDGLAVEVPDAIPAIDSGAGTLGRGALVRVKPNDGTRTILSDFGDAAQGPRGQGPVGVAREPGGTILVSTGLGLTSLNGVLFRVEAATGERTLISEFGNASQGPLGVSPTGVAIILSPSP